MIKDIITFNREVLGITRRPLQFLSAIEFDYLTSALHEEIFEMVDAQEDQNLSGFVDSVLDLCYFAIGGLYRAGLTEEQIKACFNVIHEANMTKKQGKQGKRGGLAIDAVKPIGWKAPDQAIKEILNCV